MSKNTAHSPSHLAQPDPKAGRERQRRRAPSAPPFKRRPASAKERAGISRSSAAKKADARTRSTLLYEKSLLPMVEHVHRIDQASLRVGVIWLLILPVLLLVIRKLTGSSKLTFLIIWIVGMFIISAALILIAYADHELKNFLEDVKQYEPAASEASLDGLIPKLDADLSSLPVSPEVFRSLLERRRAQRSDASSDEESAEDRAHIRLIEDWLRRLEEAKGKEERHEEHSPDHPL